MDETDFKFEKEQVEENIQLNIQGGQEIIKRITTLFRNAEKTVQYYREIHDYTIEMLEDIQYYYQMQLDLLNKLNLERIMLEEKINELKIQKSLIESTPDKKQELNTADVYVPNQNINKIPDLNLNTPGGQETLSTTNNPKPKDEQQAPQENPLLARLRKAREALKAKKQEQKSDVV